MTTAPGWATVRVPTPGAGPWGGLRWGRSSCEGHNSRPRRLGSASLPNSRSGPVSCPGCGLGSGSRSVSVSPRGLTRPSPRLYASVVRTNRDYYDEFASWYERERGRGYHEMLDELESRVALRVCPTGRILEAGCGTGLVLQRLRRAGASAVGIDLSRGMLGRASERRLPVAQADLLHLPFPNDAFDLVCSFKVLAHVQPIREAIAELARVTRPGGHLVLEFYNRHSLRTLIKRLKPPSKISQRETDEAVFTRYDTLSDVQGYLPEGLDIVSVHGVRVVTPFSHVFKIPGLGSLFFSLEARALDAPVLKHFGGFLVVVLTKHPR